MRYLALATDYDGTLATDGRVEQATLDSLHKLLESGRKLIMVTGREIPDLMTTFDRLELFEWVVAENGGLLYKPATREEKLLASPPSERLVQALRDRGVGPMSVGRVIIATWEPHQNTVLEAIRDLGLEMQVIFNKGAVMILPAGVNKASGLNAALEELELSPHNVVGVGDAENDHAFLTRGECAVAVANALPTVQETADFTTRADHGAGVRELIDELVADDLTGHEEQLQRHHILIGKGKDGEVRLGPYGFNVLIVGSSGGGKSTLTTGLLERLAEADYQMCVIDPEGDYETFEQAVVLGNSERAPAVDEILQLLKNPKDHVVVNLIGLPIADRPPFFVALLPQLQTLRSRTGRPHWLVVDETHHLLPASWEPALLALPQDLTNLVRITVHPSLIHPTALKTVGTLIAVGDRPDEAVREFCQVIGETPPHLEPTSLEKGEALFWSRQTKQAPFTFRVTPSRSQRRRHSRKYAEGELPADRSFYFTGPDNKLKLRAQNLILFLQLAEGVDEETRLFHLRRGDYSRWFRDGIKDDELAQVAAEVEGAADHLSAEESWGQIKAAISARYTLPAGPPLPVAGTTAERK
jgi:HAD superfamily hydrolase (TIGR01484 family)